MNEKTSAGERIREWLKDPQVFRWFSSALALLIVLVFIRACSIILDANGPPHYKIARDETWYPLNFFGRGKNVLGFSDDLLLTIAKRKKIHIQLISAPPGDLLETLDANNAVGILSSLTPDSVLQESYLFSDPYYNLGAVLIVDINSPIKSLADMSGKYLGLPRGSTVLFSISDKPQMQVAAYDNIVTALDDITRNRIDGVILNQLNAYNFTTGYYKNKLKVVTSPLTSEGLRLITHRSPQYENLITLFNEGLAELKADGTYAELLKKWDLHNPIQ
jgi:polar amino acid transport system substrate-binding protein